MSGQVDISWITIHDSSLLEIYDGCMIIRSRRIFRTQIFRLRALPEMRQYHNNHQLRNFTVERTNTADDNTNEIDLSKYIRALRTPAIYGLYLLAERTVAFKIAEGRYATALKISNRKKEEEHPF